MKILDVVDAYRDGPNSKESNTMENTSKRRRVSKLIRHAELINKYRADKRSLQYICDRLKQDGIQCSRSTVLRFLSKQREL